jgi:hypothetical protein
LQAGVLGLLLMPGCQLAGHGRLAATKTPMPGPWTRSVIHVAIGGQQVMATDRNQRSVIS